MSPAPSEIVAVDTSVAIPLLIQTHQQHDSVSQWARGRRIALAGHAAVETYSVLTRLPGDLRVAAKDAVTLLSARFEEPYTLSAATTRRVPSILASAGISGGAAYDGLVALAARERRATLATRDERARSTYRSLGVSVEIAE